MTEAHNSLSRNHDDAPILTVGDVEMDVATHTVSANGQPVSLTLQEFRLLQALLEHFDRVMTAHELLTCVWGLNHTGDPSTLTVHILPAAHQTRTTSRRSPPHPNYPRPRLHIRQHPTAAAAHMTNGHLHQLSAAGPDFGPLLVSLLQGQVQFVVVGPAAARARRRPVQRGSGEWLRARHHARTEHQ